MVKNSLTPQFSATWFDSLFTCFQQFISNMNNVFRNKSLNTGTLTLFNGFPESITASGSGDVLQHAAQGLVMEQGKERQRVWLGESVVAYTEWELCDTVH